MHVHVRGRVPLTSRKQIIFLVFFSKKQMYSARIAALRIGLSQINLKGFQIIFCLKFSCIRVLSSVRRTTCRVCPNFLVFLPVFLGDNERLFQQRKSNKANKAFQTLRFRQRAHDSGML